MRLLVAWLVAVAVAGTLSIVLGFLFHGLSPWVSAAALIGGGIVGAYAFWLTPKRAGRGRLSIFDILILAVFSIVSLRVFCRAMYFDGPEIKTLFLSNAGDLALHLTYINYLASGVPFWPDNPLLTGAKLSYPVGIDLFNALLVSLHMEDRTSIVCVGLLSAAATAWALYRWGGAFTIAGFLFNGGLAGFRFFQTWKIADYQSAYARIEWSSIFLTMFVSQRGLLYAIPVGLTLLCQWRARLAQATGDAASESTTSDLPFPFWIELLLYATLPLFHFHTFLFLSALLAWWFLFGPSVVRAQVLRLVALAFVPATVLVTLITGYFRGGSGVHIHPGWKQENTPFFQFWGLNFGLTIPLVLLLCGVLIYKFKKPRERANEDRLARAFVFPAVLVFLTTCVVMFAPAEWDNMKIMIWSYLVVLPFLWSHLIARMQIPWRVAFCFGLFFSGMISLVGGLRPDRDYVIADRTELEAVRSAVRQIPRDEWFIAAPDIYHPLQLVGRKIVLGFVGHLTSHGVDPFDEEEKVAVVMLGQPGWQQTARELRARYLFWGEPEREYYVNSTQPWRATAKLVASGDWGEIYDLEQH